MVRKVKDKRNKENQVDTNRIRVKLSRVRLLVNNNIFKKEVYDKT